MLNDELTVFDIKYNEGLDRLNNLLSDHSYTSSIKNYVERYKLDKSLEDRNSKQNYITNSNYAFKDNRRNKVVDLYEIRSHDRKVQQFRNKNYLKNEIEWFKIKEREDEQKNKYNYNKQKYQIDISDNNKDVIRKNNLKMKKFSSIANKVNIDKFLEKKKINKILNNEKKNVVLEQSSQNNNNFQDGVFIPYSEYKKYEQIMMNKNRKNNMNLKKINNNLNSNKSYKNVKLTNNINQKKLNIKKNNTNKNINNNRKNNIISHSININNNKIQSASMIKNKNKIPKKNTSLKNIDNRYNIDIRKPLEKRIDYLREKSPSLPRIKIYDSKKLFKDKKDILNNIDSLNYYSKKYETEAKRQEQLMRVRGNKSYGDDDNIKLTNLLIDSISTKLAILNQFTSDKNK